MLELIFYSNGIVHIEFNPEDAIVNKTKNVIQFTVRDLSFGIQRIGSCCMAMPLHLTLSLS
jgi:hypothetical protein